MGSLACPHFAIFPFMSQGHTIPLLYLTRLLRRRSAAITIFTTVANSPPIRACLENTGASIIELPFPQNIEGVPQGVENTHKLPSMSCFPSFLKSTKLMQKSFENALESLNPPVSCIISDGFLGFTLESARRFNVPRLAFWGSGIFWCTVQQILEREKPHAHTKSLDEPFSLPGFPQMKLTKNDLVPPFNEVEPSDPFAEFIQEQINAVVMSHGLIVNSFYEMEKRYFDYWNDNVGAKALCVGPLCLAAPPPPEVAEKPFCMQFLDEKLAAGDPVLYVAFGSQAVLSEEQFEEIAEGLEKSQVSFLWALKPKGIKSFQDFEERVKNRGILVRDWVDQLQILEHEAVQAFLSHCGWNSLIESVSSGVPILALPFMAEQHLNVRLVEEVGLGLRMKPSGGSVRGLVAAEEVERMVREMMGGERGAEARRKAAEYGGTACDAMKEGGSSMQTLDLLTDEMSQKTMSFSYVESCQEGQRFCHSSS